MTQKPASNGLTRSEPFNRWVADNIDLNSEQLEVVQRVLDENASLFQSTDGSLQSLRQMTDLLTQQMSQIYAATGNTWPPVPIPPTPQPVVPVETTVEIGADWSATWGSSSQYAPGGREDTNGNYLYQGSNPENKIGIWHHNFTPVLGKKIIAAEFAIRNLGAPYSSSVVAGFGAHTFGAVPGSKPGRNYGWDASWGRGVHAWTPVPPGLYEGISNGTIQGFSVGGIGPSDPNYAYWAGVGAPNPPTIRIRYQV